MIIISSNTLHFLWHISDNCSSDLLHGLLLSLSIEDPAREYDHGEGDFQLRIMSTTFLLLSFTTFRSYYLSRTSRKTSWQTKTANLIIYHVSDSSHDAFRARVTVVIQTLILTGTVKCSPNKRLTCLPKVPIF